MKKHVMALACGVCAGLVGTAMAEPDALRWPAESHVTKPWTFWHWMGNAVDKTHITEELGKLNQCGLGGVLIVQIQNVEDPKVTKVPFLSAQWADTRVALTVSNDSGCTGAALSRNKQGENLASINSHFPHWFCANYKHWNGREGAMPFDQHELIALCAPRLVYVASASEDSWSDPAAEFRSCVAASPVWGLHGLTGVAAKVMPKPEQPLHGGCVGYHLRTGKHDLTPYDWQQFITFALQRWH